MIGTYSQSYTEILEIIKNMDQPYKDKIPAKLIKFFEDNKDNNYKYNIAEMQDNPNMMLSQKTIDLLAMIELKYLATEAEKELLKDCLDKNDVKYQTELREKYNPDNIFGNKETKDETDENSVALVEDKESVFKKIIKWFKRSF